MYNVDKTELVHETAIERKLTTASKKIKTQLVDHF